MSDWVVAVIKKSKLITRDNSNKWLTRVPNAPGNRVEVAFDKSARTTMQAINNVGKCRWSHLAAPCWELFLDTYCSGSSNVFCFLTSFSIGHEKIGEKLWGLLAGKSKNDWRHATLKKIDAITLGTPNSFSSSQIQIGHWFAFYFCIKNAASEIKTFDLLFAT